MLLFDDTTGMRRVGVVHLSVSLIFACVIDRGVVGPGVAGLCLGPEQHQSRSLKLPRSWQYDENSQRHDIYGGHTCHGPVLSALLSVRHLCKQS